ncbi:3-hydroxybutyrate dehydrogenase [Pyrenochaeta sp. DS3sAY3a]|nr:3-hydroxybutyrate dehydrogenase [Pyrenochaeta sp. DS3sAY3a]
MSFSVKNKTALVTGGGSGIGYEFTKLLLENGANVFIADLCLRPESEELIAKYQSHPKATFHKIDVTDWAQLDDMFVAATEQFGTIDIVSPSAGIFEPPISGFWIPPGTKPSIDDPHGGRHQTVDVNFTHPIRVSQLTISHFMCSSPTSSSENPKSIVHTCSVASQGAGMMFPLYVATKHGLDGFVRSMGDLEASHGIRVTAVEPGAVKTPLFTEHPEKMRMMDQKLDDWVYPQEVAKVMLALVQNHEVGNDEIFSTDRVFDKEAAKIQIRGGSVVEVLVGNLREVPLFGNQGPMSSGAQGWKPSAGAAAYQETVQMLKPGWGQV